MTFARKPMPPRRERDVDEFASYSAAPSRARMVTAADLQRAAVVVSAALTKTSDRKQQSIRDSARGEECTVRIPGACAHDPAKTIWSHAPLGAAGKGGQIKALDLCGSYCCTACDAVVDGQAPAPAGVSRGDVLLAWMYGHMRSLVRLRQKGLV